MPQDWPFRWPGEWREPRLAGLLSGTPVSCVLVEEGAISESLRRAGISAARGLPPEVEKVTGVWPGVRSAEAGGAGPTGAPWVDANGWLIRLARVRHPGKSVWVEAPPPKQNEIRDSAVHRVAVAEAAAYGGSWLLTLDRDLASGIAQSNREALESWKRILRTMRFFAAHREWQEWRERSVMGLVSDFTGDNEFLSQEILNLSARNQQVCRIVEKAAAGPASFRGLRAVLYFDAAPPPPALRKALLEFASEGGLVVAGTKWGAPEGVPAQAEPHPRYAQHTVGKGRLAVAAAGQDDPYEIAADAQILLSHRHDLLRFWNGGSICARYLAAPDGRGLVHLVNYAARPGSDAVSLRVAGRYRTARLWDPDQPAAAPLRAIPAADSIELHLPPFSVYAGVELSPA